MKAVSQTHTFITKMSKLDPKGTERAFRYCVSHIVGSVSVGILGYVGESCEELKQLVVTSTEDARARVIFHAVAPCVEAGATGGAWPTWALRGAAKVKMMTAGQFKTKPSPYVYLDV